MTDSLWPLIQIAYLTGWAVAAPIGPVNMEIMRRVLQEGLPAGILVGLGAVCIDAIYLTVFSVGLGAFLEAAPVQRAFFLAGGGVLLYVGIGAMREALRMDRRHILNEVSAEPAGAETRVARPWWRHYVTGLAMTATNPMTVAFWSALALQFTGISPLQRVAASGALVAGCFSWVLAITFTVAFARRWLGGRLLALITLAGGAVVVYFGAAFATRAVALDALLVRLFFSA